MCIKSYWKREEFFSRHCCQNSLRRLYFLKLCHLVVITPKSIINKVFCMNWDYNGYLICVHEVQDKTIHAPPPHHTQISSIKKQNNLDTNLPLIVIWIRHSIGVRFCVCDWRGGWKRPVGRREIGTPSVMTPCDHFVIPRHGGVWFKNR